ncbi:hybrid sensor histidine kinase/response regulator [Pantanalinema sp. GBBB05]|uniref:hybrid sensor histidine kinase/response regulator n=1 Tax=Pantanalinema sp. GBBB05 TaxID=2604139 RepID=UPI001D679859|nr:hybrid sensor histidine kinase/response regulator [Pantanalinema sp. GBBB05]
MKIDDEELREIFKAASEEHLQNLDQGLLHLEKYPDDRVTLEALMRETHSLKGDANMLGLKDLGTLAHQMEHILGSIKRGEQAFSAHLGDRLSHGLAAIRKLIDQAITGESAGINTFYVLAELMGASGNQSEQKPSADSSNKSDGASQAAVEEQVELAATVEEVVIQSEVVSEIAAVPSPEVGLDLVTIDTNGQSGHGILQSLPEDLVTLRPSLEVSDTTATQSLLDPVIASVAATQTTTNYHIETIRVPTRNLDELMTQVGELTVNKIRIAHRLGEVEAIANLWEECNRELLRHQSNKMHLDQCSSLINQLRRSLAEDTARLEQISTSLEEEIRTLRLLPLATLFNLFPRLVRDLARQEGKQIELVMVGGDTKADKRILEEMRDPLMHMLRNAVDHGIESPQERQRQQKPTTGKIYLRGYQTPTHVVIEVSDDGQGLDLEKIKQTAIKRGICREEELATMSASQIQALIFAPGFSTRTLVTEVSGRGVGLDVVQTHVDRLKGSIQVESLPSQGCTICLQLSMTLATAHVLIVSVQGESYAIPVEAVETACLVQADSIFTIEGREAILYNDQPVSVVHLAEILELPPERAASTKSRNAPTTLACLILKTSFKVGSHSVQEQTNARLGVFVDALVDEQDVVLKPQSQLLKRVRNISGATILGTGRVCMVLNPIDLFKSVRRSKYGQATKLSPQVATPPRKLAVLLVEDSIATRTQEKRILESAGYEVVTAVDGLDGFNKLQTRAFDAIVSDVQMPNLSGLELAARIRQHREYNELPIILVTTLASDEDKRRGAEAGANAYITKSSFNQEVLLETLKRLV